MIRAWFFVLTLFAQDGETIDQQHWYVYPERARCESARGAMVRALGDHEAPPAGRPKLVRVSVECRFLDMPRGKIQ